MKKKKIYLLVFSLALFIHGQAQVTIGDQTAPQPFSILELMTNIAKGGIRLPQLTTAQRDSIALTPAFVSNPNSAGLVIYNTDTNCLEFWNLDHWVSRCGVPAAETYPVIAGIVWASKNVDAPGTFAANIWDFGMFYQWDSKIAWSSSDPLTSIPAGQVWNSTGSSATAWDMTNNNPCPSGWRVPTNAELTALYNAGSVWITGAQATSLGIGSNAGRIFGVTILPAAFSNSTMVFLPASRYRNGTNSVLYSTGSIGGYWSSVPYISATSAYYLDFLSSTVVVTTTNKASGYSVRCVAQ